MAEDASRRAPTPRRAPADGAARAPLAPPAPTDDAIDLSVVVVFYNMRREAARTLHSLSRAYQQGIDDLDYEVIVVENGSADDEQLGEEFVRSFGPEFRYLDLGDGGDAVAGARAQPRARASRAGDVDRADDRRRARAHAGRAALRHGRARDLRAGDRRDAAVVRRARASRATRMDDRLRPGVRGPAVRRRSTGRSDGYRLFEIGHFIGDRDWLDGVWESNCMFVPRKLLEQVGGFDESFSMPGGGYANLDSTSGSARRPDVTVVTILGEGSFHQVHGGTTTNQPDPTNGAQRIVSATASTTPSCAAGRSGAREADPLRRDDVPERAPDAAPAA